MGASATSAAAPQTPGELLRFERVTKSFGAAPVLRDLDLCLGAGRVIAVIGPGASGKSLLLKLAVGLVAPDRGRILLDGVEITGQLEPALRAVRQRVGMLFQNYALFDRSVGENVAFPLRRLSPPPPEEEIAARVAERLERVALPGIEERNPATLSGGQKKRVGIARATITRPPIVLYDEPVAGLDPVTSQKIYDLIVAEQRARGDSVVVVSSDVSGVLSIAHEVVMLHAGRVCFHGSVDEARATGDPVVRQFVHGLVDGPL